MQPGDVVQLRSGGPFMTIRHVEDNLVTCEWFEGAKNHRPTFTLPQLEKVDQ